MNAKVETIKKAAKNKTAKIKKAEVKKYPRRTCN